MQSTSRDEATVNVLLAPPGAGKTEYVLQLLREMLARPGWGQIQVLLPNRTQEHFFRQRLFAASEPGPVAFNLRFPGFGDLAATLLNLSDNPARPLREGERLELLRVVLEELEREGALNVYTHAGEMPGLLRAIARLIDELREQLLPVAEFAAAAQAERDRELALIARRYLATLKARGLHDRVGQLTGAREALDDGRLRSELNQGAVLLVDGFDHFTPLQASLLLRLAATMRRTTITLPYAPGREDRVGAGFRHTLDLLRKHSVGSLRVDRLPAGYARRDESLQQLTIRLFDVKASPLQRAGCLHMLEAPGAAQEARAITRRIKGLLLESDARPEDFLIVLRDWTQYAGPLRVAGREHAVPLVFARGFALAQVPAICHLFALLELPGADFPLQEALDVLRAPCFRIPGLRREQARALEAIGRKKRLPRGRDAWLAAVAADDVADGDTLSTALREFMENLTPPLPLDRRELWRWLRRLCGLAPAHDEDAWSLDMRASLPAKSNAFFHVREREALAALDKVLRNLERGNSFRQQQQVVSPEDVADCWQELRAVLERESVGGRQPEPGAVFVIDADRARGLSHHHVFIPGLSAGIFPRASTPDPLLLASERNSLKAVGVNLRQGHFDGDAALFFQLTGLARASLMLTRPTEENGALRPPGHLWQAVLELCPDQVVKPVRPGHMVPVREVASPQEALVTLAGAKTGATAPLRRWLQREQGGLLKHVEHARKVEAKRLSRFSGHDHFSGKLADPYLIAQVAEKLGPEWPWSATQLNDLGACRFRFFASRILKLEELWQPQPGLNALELGRLNHAILERSYADLEQRGLTIEERHLDEALAALERSAREVFDEAECILERPLDALWPQEQQFLRSRLQGFVRLDFSGDSPVGKHLRGPRRNALWLEQGFGMDDADFRMALEMDGQCESLRLSGVIDRLDVVGNRALVIDYKSGSSAISLDDLREGVNVQMLVYLRAAEQLLREEADVSLAGGIFLHLRSLASSGRVQLNVKGEELLRAAELRIAKNIAAARRGDFSVEPRRPANSGRCTAYCEFSELCRVAVTQGPVRETDA